VTQSSHETEAASTNPFGGHLVNLAQTGERRAEWIAKTSHLASIQISARALCDIELLATGAFSPLDRFMSHADYERVLHEMRLNNDVLFPLPITLTADPDSLPAVGERIALRDSAYNLIAVMDLEEVFDWDPVVEAALVLRTTDLRHPLVSEMNTWGKVCISGALHVVNLPRYYDFTELRRSPTEVRDVLKSLGVERVVAYQTRTLMHRAQEELTKRATASIDGSLLIQPVVGLAKPGDVDYYARMHIYMTLVEKYYDPGRTLLNLLPFAARMAGPREAVLQAIISRNYGATHFLTHRRPADAGNHGAGRLLYEPNEAWEMLERFAPEMGVKVQPAPELVFLPGKDSYVEAGEVPAGEPVASITETQVREDYLEKGKLLPEWFTRRETSEILANMHPPRNKQGFCIWFTGLSGSGKSTTSEILTRLLMGHGRQVTVLDGDVVRTHLSKGLGFSKEDRDTNILRIGFVASEIVRHNGVVICAAVSPYRAARNEARKMIGENRFIMVYVDTPIEVCTDRDVKGMYARARRGEIKGFTGVDDPYEPPLDPEITLDTVNFTPEQNARRIVTYLEEQGFLLRQA
jgi:sulfate adenylyltransferase